MPYRLIFPDSYLRRAKRFLKKHPEIRSQYRKTLELLELNPHHPSLRLHRLQGRLAPLSSVSINMSYRIVLEIVMHENDIILVDVGHHDHVYRSD
jgi:mRNA-degrading endonuclease YafQ of YafQ-DinJ toxin-antitoxin module